jgi:hypothetical protein
MSSISLNSIRSLASMTLLPKRAYVPLHAGESEHENENGSGFDTDSDADSEEKPLGSASAPSASAHSPAPQYENVGRRSVQSVRDVWTVDYERRVMPVSESGGRKGGGSGWKGRGRKGRKGREGEGRGGKGQDRTATW